MIIASLIVFLTAINSAEELILSDQNLFVGVVAVLQAVIYYISAPVRDLVVMRPLLGWLRYVVLSHSLIVLRNSLNSSACFQMLRTEAAFVHEVAGYRSV